jgi:hypothetical protein
MMPSAVRTGELLPPISARPARRVAVRLWLPLTPLLWLLSPLPLVFAPLVWLAPARMRPAHPYLAVIVLGRLLLSLSGTVVDVDTPDALVRIRIV